MHPKRRWKTDIARRLIGGAPKGRSAYMWGQPAPHVRDMSFALVESLLESRVGYVMKFHDFLL
jgi:hypothetical protein